MPSSRSAPDPLDPGPRGFAHRGLHHPQGPAENSLDAFAAALELGCGIECDLRLTRDGEVVVFHDADAMRLCKSPLAIARSTLAEIAALRLGGAPIPTLEALLRLVAGRVPLLLEAKVDRDAVRFGRALVGALDGYRGPLGVMSFDPGLMRWLLTNAPHLRRGLVIGDRLSLFGRWRAMRLADPQFLAVKTAVVKKPWAAAARAWLPVYSWTVKTEDERRTLAPFADALIWEADGRP